MKSIGLKVILLAVLFLMSNISAMATIETIKGTLTCFLGCGKNVTQFIAQGENHSFEVVGQFVDLSTEVQITGSGVSVSYGTRKGGSNSSIIVRFDVNENAAPGERTVKLRYAIETNGPDTFTVKVVKKGNISQVQYKKPVQQFTRDAHFQLSPATNLPLNEKIVLVVTGTKLNGVELRSGSNYRNQRILAGATDTKCEIEIEFTTNGQEELALFDSSLSQSDMSRSTSSDFRYTGGANRKVQYGGTQTNINTGGGFISPILGSSGNNNTTFVDVAPRANMLNVFRRQFQTPNFTENGVQYFSINSEQFCNGMSGTQSKIITIPNPVWGVSNVGTADVNTNFAAQLRSGTQTLTTENITGLNPGETKNFTFTRQDSRVRVFTFLVRNGCFVSPTADEFFEDPAFTVVVNTNNALTEAAANNSRNY